MNDLIQFNGSVELQAAATDGTKPATFAIVGYTGVSMQANGFSHPVIVELSGVKTTTPEIPIYLNHDEAKIVGQGTPTIDASGIRVDGTITGEDEPAQTVKTHAKNGFKWQASIGANIVRREFLAAGKTANVNGREVTGPMIIARETLLQETSFVGRGADSNTSATIAAKKGLHMPDITTTDATERDRIKAVSTLADQYAQASPDFADKIDGMLQAAFDNGIGGEEFEIQLIRGCRPQRSPALRRPGTGTSSRDMLSASLMIRSGNENLAVKAFGEQLTETARRQRINSMVDLCAAALTGVGRHPGDFGSNDEMVKAAWSYANLPTVLADTVGRVLVNAYEETTSSWKTFAFVASADDFRTQTGIRPAAIESLEELGAAGEIKHGTLKEEATYSWKVDTFAKMISVDRKTITNDNLGFISQLAPAFGTAAGRSLNDLVWSTILGGVTANFFHAANNANYATTASALAVGTLGAGVAAMRSQRDSKGYDLNISPAVLVVGPSLELTARSLLNSGEILGTSGPNGNPTKDIVASLIIEPRIENSDRFTGTSSTQWYLFGAPSTRPITVGFLQAKQTPTIEMEQAPFDRLGLQMRVVFDYGVALSDPKAAYLATGAGG